MFNYVNNKINTHNCVRAYSKQSDLQIPAEIHKMVFVNRFPYNSINIANHISLEIRNCHRLYSFNPVYLSICMDITKL